MTTLDPRLMLETLREAVNYDDRAAPRTSQVAQRIAVGERVGLWCRPALDCLYVFGFGVYEGDHLVNGEMWPVIVLDDKREIVLHFTHVKCAREAHIKEKVAEFVENKTGDVFNIDIVDFLRPDFQPPTRSEAALQKAVNGEEAVTVVTEAPRRHKTVFDKLAELAAQAAEAKGRIDLAQRVIAKEQVKLEQYQKQMNEYRAEAMQLVDDLAGPSPIRIMHEPLDAGDEDDALGEEE